MKRFWLLALQLVVATSLWAQLPTVSAGSLLRIDSFPSRLIAARNIDVWLPPGYPAAGRYDVLYMHDGQMLFDSTITWNKQEWKVDETAGGLAAQGKTRPFIVVGIHNNPKLRLAEYFPENAALLLPPAERDSLLKEAGGRLLGNAYLRFLTSELKPYIDSAFQTNPLRSYTAGSSMGGLISLYALLEYPNTFRGAACLSTHWPGSFRGLHDGGYLFRALSAYVAQKLPDAKASVSGRTLRLYMDRGDKTLDSFYIRLQPQIDRIVRRKGYGDRFSSRIFPGANHSERSWAARLNEPLLFLFSQNGSRR